ncbi:MAG: 16S rRNA (guanine(527)-N(7))-methyltransferase RsmG [Firmicutes bacterium]|nr:16S rRNA (guanine(527)-N(7))-methyltransferase RsmG [Alicyclobacillaceae bacterium]MCL6496126.1 16S rRNA (guanine(527)-N(7))-methyltransferase RsmG [Bacillota bacterium]
MDYSQELAARGVDADRVFRFLRRLRAEPRNLTGFAGEAVWARGVLESLALLPWLDGVHRWVDVGTGAGWPGLVLAIARPTVEMWLVERRVSRASFLETVCRELGLKAVHVVAEPMEEAVRRVGVLREGCDGASARAVGPLGLSLELTLPAVRLGGVVLLPRGSRAREEVSEAEGLLERLGGVLERVVSLQPVEGTLAGSLLVVRKVRPTPDRFPRRRPRLGRVEAVGPPARSGPGAV